LSITYAIVGTGRISDQQLAPAISMARSADLWSVLSRSKSRAQEFADKHGAQSPKAAHDSFEELLDDPALDAVLIATPDRLHAEQALAALKAGKHVLLEKPMACDLKEGRALVEAASKAGLLLGVAYHLRFHKGHQLLAEKIANKEFGKLRHMRAQWTWHAPDDRDWRATSDVGRWWGLAGVGTHCLDLIRWYMVPDCGEIASVKSTITKNVWEGPHDETAMVQLVFESGATAEFCSSVLFESPSRVEVFGTESWAVCDNTLGYSGGGSIQTKKGPLGFDAHNPYVGEVEDFARAIIDKRQPAVTGAEGLRNIETLIKIK
jgi:1,5-anhydro-D-fructose reductase (1,5-anhydro-D-mannitol-forming)